MPARNSSFCTSAETGYTLYSPMTSHKLSALFHKLTGCHVAGVWHVGVKRLFELLPSLVITRLKQHKQKSFGEVQRQAVADASAALATFERENPNVEEDGQKKMKAELEARVKLLQQLQEKSEDPGASPADHHNLVLVISLDQNFPSRCLESWILSHMDRTVRE